MNPSSNYECAVEIREAIRALDRTVELRLQDLIEVVAEAGTALTRREEMILRLVCALIASKSWPDSPSFYGQRIEDRRTAVLLAGLWADEVIAEGLAPRSSSGPTPDELVQ